MAAAKAVVIFVGGQPLPDAEVTFVTQLGTEIKFPLTNSDGYTVLPLPAQSCYIKIFANGFKSYLQLLTIDDKNQSIRIDNPTIAPNDIVLPSLSFNKPSRDRILNVKANLCNVLDATGLPIFEPFISSLFLNDVKRASDWINRLKTKGSTHITVEITGDYNEYLPWFGDRYPIIGLDFTQALGTFRKFLDYILSNDLIPIIKSGCDGQGYSPEGKTYGWSWGMANMPGIYEQLKDYKNLALWSTGYDGCFPDWNPDQLLQFIRMMRQSLGTEACIDTETGGGPGESISYCHLGNGAADWSEDKLGDLDSFSLELLSFAQSDAEIAGQIEGMKEVYARIGPGGSYLHNTKTQVQMYETLAYWEIRKYADFNQAEVVAQRAKAVGYTTFGNGLP